MPGIPLLNLGYGLGGLVQGYQNQQSQGLQQALQRLALQQAQSQSNAQTLAGLALQAGLLNPTSGGGPLSPINYPMPQTASAAPSAPAAGGLITTGTVPGIAQGTPTQNAFNAVAGGQQPPNAATTNPTFAPGVAPGGPAQQTFTPPSPYSLDDTRSGMVDQPPIYAPGPGQPDFSQAPDTPQQQSPPPPSPPPAPAPQQSDQNGDTSSAPARSDSSSAPSPSGGSVAAVFPNGQSIDISSMFKTIDYQKLAQGIAQLAPRGTSQADIYAAVLDLGKLAEGDKVQQQQAGLLARALLGGQFKLAGIGEQQAGAMARTQAQQAGATGRTELQQAGAGQRTAATTASRERIAQEQIASREKIAADAQQLRRDLGNIHNANEAVRAAQAAQRIAISAQNAGRQDVALQLQAIGRQISAIKAQPDGSYTPEQQQQLKLLGDRAAQWGAMAAQATTPSGP